MSVPAGNAEDLRARLIDAGGLSLDRMPILNVVFDRLTSGCSDNLKPLVASPVYFAFDGFASGRFGEMLDAYEGNAVAGIFHAPDWNSHILVGLDRDFLFTLVEALLGADGSEPPLEDERAFSGLEIRIAQTILEQVGKALESSFSLVSPTPFRLERTETRMEFAVIGGRGNKAVEAKFAVQALDRGGEMFLILPQSVINPMRPALSRVMTADSTARDPAWTQQIAAEVQKAEVTLRAVLEERTLTLGEIADLKVGQVIGLDATPATRVRLEGNERPLFWCHMGQAQGAYVLRVDEAITPEREGEADDAVG